MFLIFQHMFKKYRYFQNLKYIYLNKKTFTNKKDTEYNLQKNKFNDYIYNLYKSIENCEEGTKLFKLTQKALKYQIHDISIWRLIEQKYFKLKYTLKPNEISLIINYFKQIKINDTKIYEDSLDIIISSIDKFSLQDLSLICLSYTYFNKSNISFMNILAQAIIKLHEQYKYDIQNISDKQLYNSFVSYVHIIGSFAKVQIKNVEIFKIASIYIYKYLQSNFKISQKLLIKIIDSYANVKIKHTKIFDLIVEYIPTIKITDDELKNIRNNFKLLKYSNETFEKYAEYRLS